MDKPLVAYERNRGNSSLYRIPAGEITPHHQCHHLLSDIELIRVELLRRICQFVHDGHNDEAPVYLLYKGTESNAQTQKSTTIKRSHACDEARLGHRSRTGRAIGYLWPLMQTSAFVRGEARALYRRTVFHVIRFDHLQRYRDSPFCEAGLRGPRCGVYMDFWEHGKDKVPVDQLFNFQQWHDQLVLVAPRMEDDCHRTQMISQLVKLRGLPWIGALLQGAKKLISSIEVDRFGDIYLVPQDLPAAPSVYDHNVHDFLRLISPFTDYFRVSVNVHIQAKPKVAHTRDRHIKITCRKTTHRQWVKGFQSRYILGTQCIDGELVLLPNQRFRDECKSFGDLKINSHLLRRMTNTKLWLRIMDGEHDHRLHPPY